MLNKNFVATPKGQFATAFGACIVLTVVSTVVSNLSEPNYSVTIRLSHARNAGSYVDLSAHKFKELLQEKSDKQLSVNIYPNNGLAAGDQEHVIEMLKNGAIDIQISSATDLYNLDNRFGTFWLPFLFENDDQINYFVNNEEVRSTMQSWLDPHNITLKSMYSAGARQLSNNVKEITSPDDLKGMNFRIPPFEAAKRTFELFGANPVSISFSEVPMALEHKTIQGQESNLALFLSAKLYEHQQYVTLWNGLYDIHVWLANDKAMEQLTPAQQKAVEDSIKETIAWQQNMVEGFNKLYLKTLTAKGVKITSLTPEQMKAFQAKALPIYEKFIELFGTESLEFVLSHRDSSKGEHNPVMPIEHHVEKNAVAAAEETLLAAPELISNVAGDKIETIPEGTIENAPEDTKELNEALSEAVETPETQATVEATVNAPAEPVAPAEQTQPVEQAAPAANTAPAVQPVAQAPVAPEAVVPAQKIAPPVKVVEVPAADEQEPTIQIIELEDEETAEPVEVAIEETTDDKAVEEFDKAAIQAAPEAVAQPEAAPAPVVAEAAPVAAQPAMTLESDVPAYLFAALPGVVDIVSMVEVVPAAQPAAQPAADATAQSEPVTAEVQAVEPDPIETMVAQKVENKKAANAVETAPVPELYTEELTAAQGAEPTPTVEAAPAEAVTPASEPVPAVEPAAPAAQPSAEVSTVAPAATVAEAVGAAAPVTAPAASDVVAAATEAVIADVQQPKERTVIITEDKPQVKGFSTRYEDVPAVSGFKPIVEDRASAQGFEPVIIDQPSVKGFYPVETSPAVKGFDKAEGKKPVQHPAMNSVAPVSPMTLQPSLQFVPVGEASIQYIEVAPGQFQAVQVVPVQPVQIQPLNTKTYSNVHYQQVVPAAQPAQGAQPAIQPAPAAEPVAQPAPAPVAQPAPVAPAPVAPVAAPAEAVAPVAAPAETVAPAEPVVAPTAPAEVVPAAELVPAKNITIEAAPKVAPAAEAAAPAAEPVAPAPAAALAPEAKQAPVEAVTLPAAINKPAEQQVADPSEVPSSNGDLPDPIIIVPDLSYDDLPEGLSPEDLVGTTYPAIKPDVEDEFMVE